MAALFADVPSARGQRWKSPAVRPTLVLGKPQLISPPLIDGVPMPMEDFFRQSSFEGLEERFGHLYPDAAQRDAERPRYVQRLEFEINTILNMGFPGYFLIVGDFINWAKNNGCPVGPAGRFGRRHWWPMRSRSPTWTRCEVQPAVRRFLNLSGFDADFDIDFARATAIGIDYVKEKYGSRTR
ncbi:MAG: hypothetical protein R3E42_19410 [Burkholderiaceae bacterium]